MNLSKWKNRNDLAICICKGQGFGKYGDFVNTEIFCKYRTYLNNLDNEIGQNDRRYAADQQLFREH